MPRVAAAIAFSALASAALGRWLCDRHDNPPDQSGSSGGGLGHRPQGPVERQCPRCLGLTHKGQEGHPLESVRRLVTSNHRDLSDLAGRLKVRPQLRFGGTLWQVANEHTETFGDRVDRVGSRRVRSRALHAARTLLFLSSQQRLLLAPFFLLALLLGRLGRLSLFNSRRRRVVTLALLTKPALCTRRFRGLIASSTLRVHV